jgi:hypothetical protein
VCSDNEAHIISGEKGLYHIRPESKTNSSVTRFPTVGVLKKKKLKKLNFDRMNGSMVKDVMVQIRKKRGGMGTML